MTRAVAGQKRLSRIDRLRAHSSRVLLAYRRDREQVRRRFPDLALALDEFEKAAGSRRLRDRGGAVTLRPMTDAERDAVVVGFRLLRKHRYVKGSTVRLDLMDLLLRLYRDGVTATEMAELVTTETDTPASKQFVGQLIREAEEREAQ